MALAFLQEDLSKLNAAYLELTSHANQFITLENQLANWSNSFGGFVGSLQGAKEQLKVERSVVLEANTINISVDENEENVNSEPLEAANGGGENKAAQEVTKKVKSEPKPQSYLRMFRKVSNKLPAKYQQFPEHRDRLELVFASIFEIKESGITLGELVKLCGTSIVQCNEYLNTLVRLKLVTRTKEHKAIRYTVIKEKGRRPARAPRRRTKQEVNGLAMMR